MNVEKTTMKLAAFLILCLLPCTLVQCQTTEHVAMTDIMDEVADQTDWHIEERLALDDAFVDLLLVDNNERHLMYLHVTHENEEAMKEFVTAALPFERPNELKIVDSTVIVGPRILFVLNAKESSAAYIIKKLTNEAPTKPCSVCFKEVTVMPVDLSVTECLKCAAVVCGECNWRQILEVPAIFDSGDYDETPLPRCTVCDAPRLAAVPDFPHST